VTVSLKHAFTSAVADGADASLVRPSNWNAEHNLTLAADRVLGRLTTDGAVQELTGVQLLAIALFGQPRDRFYAFTDCMGIFTGSNTPMDHWVYHCSGTGAAHTPIAVGSVNAMGLDRFDLGTTTTGRVAIISSQNANLNHHKLGGGRSRFQAKLAVNQLSDGTDTYTAWVGFLDSVQAAPTDGVFFRYTHSVNSGKWECVTVSNTSETAADSGIAAVAGTYQRFTIEVNAAGTSVGFYIDGSLVQTHTLTIPTGSGRELGWGVLARRSAGTAALPALVVDWVEGDIEFTTQR
jgi:hypothetical protein